MTTTNPIFSVLGNFLMGGRTCEVICIHLSDEDKIQGLSYDDLFFRGQQAAASMSIDAFDFFKLHRSEIPTTFADKWFVFPDTVHNSRIRGMRYSQSHESWAHKHPLISRKLGPRFVLVRFI